MSNNKSILNKKAVASAALVALSGFVPQPTVQTADAATVKLTFTGKFVSGITINTIAGIKFGSIVASAAGGKIDIGTGGAYANNVNGVGITAQAQGKIDFKVLSTAPNLDITIKQTTTKLTLADIGALKKAGTAKLATINFGKQFDTAATKIVTAKFAGGKTAQVTGVNIKNTKKTIAVLGVGATITWGATPPRGSFSETLTITMTL